MSHEFHFDVVGDEAHRRRLMGHEDGPDWHTYVTALDYVRSHPDDSEWFANLNRQLDNGIDLSTRQIDNIIATMAFDGMQQLNSPDADDA